jgi:hypothetical protein
MKQAALDFKAYLKTRWNQIYTSPDAKFIFTGDIDNIKVRKEGNIYAMLN